MNIHETTTQVRNRFFLDSQKPQALPILTFVVIVFTLSPHLSISQQYHFTLFFCIFPPTHTVPSTFAEINGRDWFPVFGTDS